MSLSGGPLTPFGRDQSSDTLRATDHHMWRPEEPLSTKRKLEEVSASCCYHRQGHGLNPAPGGLGSDRAAWRCLDVDDKLSPEKPSSLPEAFRTHLEAQCEEAERWGGAKGGSQGLAHPAGGKYPRMQNAKLADASQGQEQGRGGVHLQVAIRRLQLAGRGP